MRCSPFMRTLHVAGSLHAPHAPPCAPCAPCTLCMPCAWRAHHKETSLLLSELYWASYHGCVSCYRIFERRMHAPMQVALPLFKAFATAFPGALPVYRAVRDNYRYVWRWNKRASGREGGGDESQSHVWCIKGCFWSTSVARLKQPQATSTINNRQSSPANSPQPPTARNCQPPAGTGAPSAPPPPALAPPALATPCASSPNSPPQRPPLGPLGLLEPLEPLGPLGALGPLGPRPLNLCHPASQRCTHAALHPIWCVAWPLVLGRATFS